MKKTVIASHDNYLRLDNKFIDSVLTDDMIIYPHTYGVDNTLSDDLLNKYPNCNYIVLLNEVLFQRILTDSLIPQGKIVNIENFKKYFKDFPPNTKYVYIDNNGEQPFPATHDILNEWLNLSEFHYLISSRFRRITNLRSIVGLSYLPILYMFLEQNFKQFPMLSYSSPSKPQYDFITYLGQYEKPDKRTNRYNILKQILKNDFNDVSYDKILEFDTTNDLFGGGKPGHYWNILNSLSAKIQIIFESYAFRSNSELTNIDIDEYFFTEKIMKCFILPHPYLLIIHKKWLDELENFGFKFHPLTKGESIEDFKKIVENIKMDIDGWIKENMPYFEHNQCKLYELGKSTTLPHHEFLKKILTNQI